MNSAFRAIAVAAAIPFVATMGAPAAQPSVLPQIHRGYVAAGDCVTEHALSVKSLVQCIWEVADKAEAAHRDVRAFQLGLIYAACVNADAAIQANGPLAKTDMVAASELMVAKIGLANSYRRMRRLQTQLRLSDQELIAATPIRPEARGIWLAKLRQWERTERN